MKVAAVEAAQGCDVKTQEYGECVAHNVQDGKS